MTRFSLRDIFWLTIVVALILGWALHSQRLTKEKQDLALQLRYATTLSGPTIVEFIETPLKDVATYLSDVHQVPIKLDLASLEKVGLNEKSGVTGRFKGLSLKDALHKVLDGKAEFIATEDALLIVGRDPALALAPAPLSSTKKTPAGKTAVAPPPAATTSDDPFGLPPGKRDH